MLALEMDDGARHRWSVGETMRIAAAAGFLLVCNGCSSVVTPATIRVAADLPAEEREARIATLRDAVGEINAFLASSFRHTLPAGRFELDDERGLAFRTDAGTWPIEVRCNVWGDLCVATGFTAQEREYGFVVGSSGKERERAADNSFFVFADGEPKSTATVALLILHETTHTVWREGTVGFWNGVAYYLEAIFMWRSNDHSAERRPHATGEEFLLWGQQRDFPSNDFTREYFEAHLADRSSWKNCEHGPFDQEPEPPLPRG